MKQESLRRRRKFRTESIRLKLGEPGQIAAADAGWEPKEVFDQGGGAGLAAGRITFQYHCAQSFGSGVNGCGKAGRTCTDNRQVRHNFAFVRESERTKQTGLFRDFTQ